MRPGPVIGVDVGTGSAKAVVFDPTAGVLGRGSAGYPVAHPRPGWAEQDPLAWWDATVAAVREALTDAGVDGRPVEAIAVSGQGAALVLLDAAGVPLRPALIHLDHRAAGEAAELAGGGAGAAVRQASGNLVGAWNVAAKLTWVRRHEPAVYRAARSVTSAAGFLLRRLCGHAVQNVSDAGISDLFSPAERGWDAGVLGALDVDPALLPTVVETLTDLGPVLPDAAGALGVGTGCRLIAGGEDTSSAALAAGVLEDGEGYVSLGTAGVVGVVVGRSRTAEPRLLTFPHVAPGSDLLSGSMTSAGSALDWLASVVGVDATTLLAEAAGTAPGADGVVFLPYLAGELHPVNDPAARGAFAGLSLTTGRAHLGRAVLEGSAGAIAHNLAVAGAAGARPRRLSATGRPTSCPAWCQAIADATGLPVDAVAAAGAPLGDALIAASHTTADLAVLARRHRQLRATYQPRVEEHAAATHRRAAAARLYDATRERR